ncbi:uncharacterized protein KRP23_14940 [Phytophthora ramorum]|uniref:uncharacterized protein n=1 Tax=Phytophthora ramorum TaxID=164328 RepID=UPI00309665B1|nr:hypothetical protein KRP23_14940 [Phytophthora ramorum]
MVKLVEYPDSSEDERDAASDGSQWSSFGQVPSSPSDSFSYPMRSPESDEDEDYAPSETSLEPPDSDTQSVDTDDLDPHDEDTLDEEEDTLEQEEDTLGQEEDDSGGQKQDPDIIDLTQPKGRGEAGRGQHVRRGGWQVELPGERHREDEEAAQTAEFGRAETAHGRVAEVLDAVDQGTFFSRECATAFPTSATEEKQDAAGAGQTSSPMFNFKAPRVETPAFGAEQKAASVPKTPGLRLVARDPRGLAMAATTRTCAAQRLDAPQLHLLGLLMADLRSDGAAKPRSRTILPVVVLRLKRQ